MVPFMSVFMCASREKAGLAALGNMPSKHFAELFQLPSLERVSLFPFFQLLIGMMDPTAD